MRVRKSLDCLKEIVSRNVNIKSASGGISVLLMEIKNTLLKTGGKEIFVIKWQNCGLLFHGRYNLDF